MSVRMMHVSHVISVRIMALSLSLSLSLSPSLHIAHGDDAKAPHGPMLRMTTNRGLETSNLRQKR